MVGAFWLIHVSQLSKDKDGNPLKGFQIKDEIEAEIVHVSQKDKKIGLSIRKLEESSERDVQRSYAKKQKQATSNLGDLLIEKMMNLTPQISLDSHESESDKDNI